jgi:hypothetical protein
MGPEKLNFPVLLMAEMLCDQLFRPAHRKSARSTCKIMLLKLLLSTHARLVVIMAIAGSNC